MICAEPGACKGAYITERRDVYRVLVGKLAVKRQFGRPRYRWEIILKWIFRK